MALQSILDQKHNLKKLEESYIKNRMSTTDISNDSLKLFGKEISAASVYNAIIRNKIPIRNKSDSVSMAMTTLDANKTFLNKSTIEWIDGFLLGDGSINFKHNEQYRGSRFTFGSSQEEWANYAMSGLKDYQPRIASTSGKIREKSPNLIWCSGTLTHPDIVSQAKRWYPISNNYKKKIPQDIRITPLSVLLWYLGDGSITKYGVSYVVRIATCSFDPLDIETILMPRLKEVGIDSIRTKEKNDIKIPTQSLKDFFNFIGKKSPINCYNYKFEYAPWLSLYRISDIAKNDQEKWRIQYLYKSGKLDCQKSPGDKIILFNEEQKNKIQNILSKHIAYNTYDNISKLPDNKKLIKLSDIINNDIERWNARYMISRGIVGSEEKSMLTEEQAKIIREKLDTYGDKSAIPSHLIDYEFLKYRQSGFPYYKYSNEELIKKINQIRNFEPILEDGLFKWHGFGTELANYFHPQMFECRKKGKMSAIEFFNSDVDFKRGIAKIIALYPKIAASNIREICCNETASSRINNFPPRVMMTILKHLYNGQNITMLDPCSGFSGRLLGSYASGIVKKYIGMDLSEKTYDGLLRTKEWINNANGFECDIIKGSCLDILPTIKENIDFIFTSPPFLDTEEYIGVPVETNYDTWKSSFIRPFIEKTYDVLKVGGKLSVYIEAIGRNDFASDFCNISKKIGFKRLDDINFKMPSRENLRQNKTFRAIKVLVFQK